MLEFPNIKFSKDGSIVQIKNGVESPLPKFLQEAEVYHFDEHVLIFTKFKDPELQFKFYKPNGKRYQ